MEDPRTDAELISALRGGNSRAYEALWKRHVGPALRYARSVFPDRAEDLVSEAFLAVHEVITTSRKGPTYAFRPYLKTVIRNTAMRWWKEERHVVQVDEVERVDDRDALRLVEDEAHASELLAAFQELPERWQRVLWLAEVAEVARPEIARQLDIKPNAVSALQRRARLGLRQQWLTRQVPPALREDPAHAARLLPAYLSAPADAALADEVTAHTATCRTCAELLGDMRRGSSLLQSHTLAAAGFGALAAAIPVVSVPTGTASAAALLAAGAGTGTLAAALAGAVGALTVGGLVISTLLAPPPAASAPLAGPAAPIVEAAEHPVPAPLPPPPAPLPPSTAPEAGNGVPNETPRLGRHNDDATIEDAGLVNDPAQQDLPVTPSAPRPATGVPGPAEGQPSTGSLSPGTTSSPSGNVYLAPAFVGRTTPGSQVAIELEGRKYTPTVAPDGAWSFDTRALQLAEGTHDYRVWAFDDTAQSPATAGSFTVLPLVVQGFENLTGNQDMRLDEASTTGVVIALTGPANGTVFVSTMQGYTAMIRLDASGQALKRLRMQAVGWYYFTFRALDADGFMGPPAERAADVYDPDVILDPWGGGGDDMTFEVVDP